MTYARMGGEWLAMLDSDHLEPQPRERFVEDEVTDSRNRSFMRILAALPSGNGTTEAVFEER